MIRLLDGRDKDFELLGTIEEIKNYLGDEYQECKDFLDLQWKIEEMNDGMDFYKIELIES